MWALTDVWRRRCKGIASVLSAAVDVEAVKESVALLIVVLIGEATLLLMTVHPRVEADVAPACVIHTCAFVILACAQQLPVILGICK